MAIANQLAQAFFEARIHNGQGYRLYFVQRGKTLAVLLADGDKSTQKNDIAKAIALSESL